MRRKIVQRMLVLLFTLVATAAVSQAATYHVTSNDRDGNGVADQNGSCVNHGPVGTGWTSCADSAANNCTLGKPCCTIQTALDKATSPGDVVEVHAGTYGASLDGTQRLTMGQDAMIFDILAVVQPCASCDTEAARRIVRGAVMTTQDMPALKGNSSTEGAIFIGGEGVNSNANFVTVQSFSIAEFSYNESGRAFVFGGGDAEHDYFIFDNITVGSINGGNDLKETYPVFSWGTAFSGANKGDFGIIKNSTLDTNVRLMHNLQSDSHTGCDTTGFISKNNVYRVQAGVTSEFGNDQGVCGAWYNDYWDLSQQGTTKGRLHSRAIQGPMYRFNNYFRLNGRWAYVQNDSQAKLQTYYYFNNTFFVPANGASQPVIYTAGGCEMANVDCGNSAGFSASSRFVNNLFFNETPLDPTESAGGRPIGGSHGFNAYKSANYCTGCPAGVNNNLGNDLAEVNDFGLNESGVSPVPFFQLDTGSAMIGAGTNNPLGQGAGVCFIDPVANWGCGDDNGNGTCDAGEICKSAEACTVIDCSVDFDGDSRGMTWDIGADEFATTVTSSLAPPTGVKRGEGALP